MLEDTGIINCIGGYKHEQKEIKDLDLDKVLTETCDYLNVDIKDVKSESRKRELVQARYYFALAVREIFKGKNHVTLNKIGNQVGRGHSDILHYYRTFDGKEEVDLRHRLKTSKEDKDTISAIKQKLNGSLEKFNNKTEGVQI